MTSQAKSNLFGALYALGAFAIFAAHDVAVKVLGAVYAPFQIIFFGVLLSFPLATLMLMRDAAPGTLRPVHPWWTALRTAAGVTTGICAFYAFSVLPLAQVYAFIFAAPLLITVLSIPILGERVGLHRWLAVVVGLIGVLIVLRPGVEPLSLGHIAGLLAALGSATAAVVVRKIGRDERSAVLMLYPMVANFIIMAAILPFVYKPMPLEHVGLVAFIAGFSFVAGLLMIAAYRAGDAAVVAPMQYSQMIWAVIWGTTLFGEIPEFYTLLGSTIIILSGLYIVVRETIGGISRNTPVLRTRTRAETGTGPRVSSLLWVRNRKGPEGARAVDHLP